MKQTLLELKGKLVEVRACSITCCHACADIGIEDADGKVIHLAENLVETTGACYRGEDYQPYDEQVERGKLRHLEYILFDHVPEGATFDDEHYKIIANTLGADFVSGCYSDWTCSSGFEPTIGQGEHDIEKEFGEHIGKFVWLRVSTLDKSQD